MADDPQARTTSHAKSVDGLVQQESALDRAQKLKEQFDHAKNQQEPQHAQQAEQSKGGAQQGSQMVKDTKLAPALTPRGPARDAVDGRVHEVNLNKEHAAEQQKIEAARKAQEAFKARQHSQDHEHDRDR
jgi:hypothetical protein